MDCVCSHNHLSLVLRRSTFLEALHEPGSLLPKNLLNIMQFHQHSRIQYYIISPGSVPSNFCVEMYGEKNLYGIGSLGDNHL